MNERELQDGTRSATECGIRKGSVLFLEPKDDPIVFVDVKYGTLFGVDRDEVIEKERLKKEPQKVVNRENGNEKMRCKTTLRGEKGGAV